MRDQLREAAPYVSMFGLFVLAASFVLRTLLGAQQIPQYLVPGLAVVGLLLLAAWPVLKPEDFREGIGGRRARFGSNALVMTISVLGILGAIAYLGSLRYWTWDLTQNKQFSISRQTVQILNDLSQPVQLTMIYPTSGSSADPQTVSDLQRLVDQYKQRGGQIEFKQVDPVADPLQVVSLANQIDENANGLGRALVAQSGSRHAVVYAFDEQSVTEAIVKATRDRELNVWFTTGHGERSLDQDYTSVRGALEHEGYTLETKSLATLTETLSADTVQAVVVAGPKEPFLDDETRALAQYVQTGGSVLLMLDPVLQGETDLNLEAVYLPWEIRPNEDVVVQPNNLDWLTPIIPASGLQFHDITRDLQNLAGQGAFPLARSIGLGTPVTSSLTTTALVKTDENTWGATDIAAVMDAAQNQTPFTQGPNDLPGPLNLAVAAQGGADSPVGRLVVFGTSQLVTDQLMQSQIASLFGLNGNLFLNTINWLTSEKDLISIRPTPPDTFPLSAPTNPNLLILATALLMPLAVIGLGSWVWWRRR